VKAILFLSNKKVEELNLPVPVIKIAGVPIFLRLLNSLRLLNISEVFLIVDSELDHIREIIQTEINLNLELKFFSASKFRFRDITSDLEGDDAIILDADLLIDEKLLGMILKYQKSAIFHCDSKPIALVLKRNDHLTILEKLDFNNFEDALRIHEISNIEKVDVSQLLDKFDYDRSKLLCIKINSKNDLKKGKKLIIFRAQKGLHFTSLINKRIEDRIVYLISEKTWITPNRITITANILALIVAIFFIKGWFKIAPILAYLVGIIDGLDGKLARARGILTKLGHIEHSFDMLYEQIWYISFAIGLYLSGYGTYSLLLGLMFLLSDTFVRHCYMQFRITMGAPLKTYSRFDLIFARIDGRRNVYLIYMILFSWILEQIYALYAMIIHSVITAFVYAVRSIQHMSKLDEIEGTNGLLNLIKKF